MATGKGPYNFHKNIYSKNGIYSDAGMAFANFKRMKINSAMAKILLYVQANPGITRRQVQEQVYGKCIAKNYSSYGGAMWRFLLAYNLIHKYKDLKNKHIVHYQILPEGKLAIEKIMANTYKVKDVEDIYKW